MSVLIIDTSWKIAFQVDVIILISLLSLYITGHFTSIQILSQRMGSDRAMGSRQVSKMRVGKVMKGKS